MKIIFAAVINCFVIQSILLALLLIDCFLKEHDLWDINTVFHHLISRGLNCRRLAVKRVRFDTNCWSACSSISGLKSVFTRVGKKNLSTLWLLVSQYSGRLMWLSGEEFKVKPTIFIGLIDICKYTHSHSWANSQGHQWKVVGGAAD